MARANKRAEKDAGIIKTLRANEIMILFLIIVVIVFAALTYQYQTSYIAEHINSLNAQALYNSFLQKYNNIKQNYSILQKQNASSGSQLNNADYKVDTAQGQLQIAQSDLGLMNTQTILTKNKGNLQLQPAGQAGASYTIKVVPNYSGILVLNITDSNPFQVTLSGSSFGSYFMHQYTNATNTLINVPIAGNAAQKTNYQYTYNLTITNTNSSAPAIGSIGVYINN